jgi:hypothetical protein
MLVLDPVQEPSGLAYQPSGRLESLQGRVLGLFSNQKLNATRLLEMISEELAQEWSFTLRRGTYHPHKLMGPAEWGDVDCCDAVILANGDCGSCSSSGIANAVALEKRGIPTFLVSTPPFVDAVRTMAELSGMKDIRWGIVAHPIGSVDEDELRIRARAAAEQFCRIVLTERAA